MNSGSATVIMGDMKKLYKDYRSLVHNLDSTFNGQVLLAEDALDIDRLELKLAIKPTDGLYKDCEMDFMINLSAYPQNIPEVNIYSVVLHPNIGFEEFRLDGTGEICLNVLDDWEGYPDGYRSLELLVQGLLFLFYEPNLEDALSIYATFSTLEELREAVNRTKYGTSLDSAEFKDELWGNIEFSNIYKGPIPKDSADEKDTLQVAKKAGNSCKDQEVPFSEDADDITKVMSNHKTAPVPADGEIDEVQTDELPNIAVGGAEKTTVDADSVVVKPDSGSDLVTHTNLCLRIQPRQKLIDLIG